MEKQYSECLLKAEKALKKGAVIPQIKVQRNVVSENGCYLECGVVRTVDTIGMNEDGNFTTYVKGYNVKDEPVLYFNFLHTCPPYNDCWD